MLRPVRWSALLLPILSQAQPPAISQNGVVNAASQMPPALAASPIARGALFHIYGVRLAGGGAVTRVRVFQNTISRPVEIISADKRRLEALMPTDAPLGKASVEVTVRDQSSEPFSIRVVRSNPAIFTRGGKGWGPGVVDNLDASGLRVENDIDHSAKPGDRVAISVTGLGEPSRVRVLMGGKVAATDSTPQHLAEGREELIVRVPGDVPQGCFVPMTIESSPFPASNFASLSVRAGGGRCGTERDGTSPVEGPRVGVLTLGRTRTEEHGRETVWDELVAAFGESTRGPLMAPLAMTPPAGTCTFFAGSYQSGIAVPQSPSSALVEEIGGRGMKSGSHITISGPGGARTVSAPTGTPGVFIGKLGGDGGPPPPRSPYLQPGSYQVTAGGGAELAPFSITLPAPPEFEWTNRGQITVVDRNRPLTITWRGVSDEQRVAIVVMNVDPASTALAACLCVAMPAAGKFTVPVTALVNLPAGVESPDPPLNVIEVLSAPARIRMHEFKPGFTTGVAFSTYGSAKLVSFR